MSAGKLLHRVSVQSQSTTQDAAGQPLTTWADVLTRVSANVRHQSGVEVLKAGADTSVVKASIMLRYRTGINAGMRVVYGTTNYNILTVAPDERKVMMYLVCEVVNVVS